MIVDSDETASQIISNKALSRSISGCVTLSGNKHTVGSLSVGKSTEPASMENKTPQLPLEIQVTYKKMRLKYQSISNDLQLLLAKRRKDERYAEQSVIMKNYGSQLIVIDGDISDILSSLVSQDQIAEQAHR